MKSSNVGIGFMGQDKGLTKTATSAAGALGTMVGAAMGLGKRFSEIKDKALAFKNALPENLTTGYEAQLVAADKAGHSLAAQLGYGSKTMGKFSAQATNMGISLNRSTEEAGKAIFAWDRGSDVLKAVGIDSKETALKVGDLGIDIKAFTYSLKEMQTSLGMDDKALKKVTESTLAWGQQSGDVTGAMATLQTQVDNLSKRAHGFGRTLSGGELADWAADTNQAKQAIFTLIPNMAKASAAADQMADTALQSGKNMGAMFAGVENDLTPFQKQLAVAGVSIGDQFKMMKTGPLGFLKGITQMAAATGKPFKEMTDDQQNFIKRTIESSGLGEEAQQALWTAMNKGPDALKGIIDKLPKATESIGALAKASFRTGRTLSDSMQLAKDQFMATLRAGTADQKYLHDSQKAFVEWGKKIKAVAAEKGPLGTMAKKMIELHKFGFAALVPEQWRGMVPMLETLGKEFGPILMGLGQMLPLLSALASPIVLVAAAIGGLVFWFVSAQKEGDSFSDTIGTMQGQAENFFLSTTDWLTKKFPKNAETIRVVMGGLSSAFYAVGEVVKYVGTQFGVVFDFIESSLNGGTNSFADFGETIHDIWHFEITEPIRLWFANLGTDVKTAFKPVVQFMASIWPTIGPYVEPIALFFSDLWKGISEGLKPVIKLFDRFSKALSEGFMNSLAQLTSFLPGGGGGSAPRVVTPAVAPSPPRLGAGPVQSPGALARQAFASPGKLPPASKLAPAVSAEARDSSLVGAINSPQWYSRYESVFLQRMAALEAAMAGRVPMGGNVGPPQRSKTKKGSTDAGTKKFLPYDVAGSPATGE